MIRDKNIEHLGNRDGDNNGLMSDHASVSADISDHRFKMRPVNGLQGFPLINFTCSKMVHNRIKKEFNSIGALSITWVTL